MGGEWRKIPFSKAVQLNPPVNLIRGAKYPFVDMASITPSSCSVFASEQREYAGGGSRFAVGDTLMARITPCLENGKIARFAGQPGEIAHGSTEFIVIRGREGVSESNYVYYLTKWEGVSGYAISQMTGTSGRQRVPIETFDHLEVPLPPLPEQRAIAHILGTLDDKIELNRRMSQTLEAMAKALFQSWFVDFEPVRAKMEGRWKRGQSLPGLPAHLYDLFPDRLVDSELGKIPEGWRVGALQDVAEHPSRSISPDKIKRSTPYIALEHMPKNTISLSNWDLADSLESNKLEFRKGEILFGKLRPYFHKVGIAPLNGVCSTDIVVIAPKGANWFGFVLSHVSSAEFVEYTNARSTGTRMPRTNWNEMASYKLALPAQAIASAFNEKLQPFFDRIIGGIHESGNLSMLRGILLIKLISGEIQVKDAERFLKENGV